MLAIDLIAVAHALGASVTGSDRAGGSAYAGTLRAVGMTRRQVRRMVRHESIITALIGAITGMALGLGLAAIVTSAFSEEGLTFAVPAGSLIAFTVVAVVAGVLAAVLPARRAARTNVLAALAYE